MVGEQAHEVRVHTILPHEDGVGKVVVYQSLKQRGVEPVVLRQFPTSNLMIKFNKKQEIFIHAAAAACSYLVKEHVGLL